MSSCEKLWQAVLCGIAALFAVVGPAAAQEAGAQTAPASPEQALAQFKAAGRDAPLTVYPTGLIGRPVRQVGDVVAMLLEQAGMKIIEVDAPEFKAPDKADLGATAKAFGEFVRANPPKTDYALFTDFLGSHEKGFEEVRAVVVNRLGETVWQDRQTPTDTDFRKIKPKEPMQCCILVVERLRPVLRLDDPTRANATRGKLAERWAEKSGLPDKAEQAALQERQQAYKKAAAAATLGVYAALAGDELSKDSAAHLVKLVNEAGLTKASAADPGPELDIKGNMNEQKVLWDMARGAREYVRTHRPDADYVLFAHYLMGKDAGGKFSVGAVHFIVCDRDGQWVIVDFQNNHHSDFNAINPKSREDCDALVVKRLKSICR